MAINIQLRRDTAAAWVTSNPLLLEGEFGIETDTKKFKLGDGVNHWNTLNYGGPRGIMPAELTLEIAFDEAYPSNYSELQYNGSGQVSRLDIWSSPTKTLSLFSKVYGYTSGKLSSVVITRIQTGSTITKTITYSNGKISSVTRAYSA